MLWLSAIALLSGLWGGSWWGRRDQSATIIELRLQVSERDAEIKRQRETIERILAEKEALDVIHKNRPVSVGDAVDRLRQLRDE